MVPFRRKAGSPKGKIRWREVKVAVLARLGQHTTRTGQTVSRLEQRRLVAVLGDIDALSPRLWLEALRQGLRSAKLVAWLSDGGRGFWRLYAERFAAHATGILDFYHAAQNLWKGTAAWLDGRTKRAHTWFAGARHQLRHGQAEEVLADIAAALDLDGLPTSAYETLTKLYAYLDKHRAHIDYQKFKALGLPLGSGLVEGACKWLIQQRFKGVGMRWSEEGFNYLLHLRLDWVNGRFDDLFHHAILPQLLNAPFNGLDVIVALKHLQRHISKRCILIWDRASIHRDRRVKAYLATQPLISVEWLPAYAPELNPEEYCHANVKRHLKNATPLTSDDIQPLIDRGFARLRKRPDLSHSFFHRAGLSVKDLWLT